MQKLPILTGQKISLIYIRYIIPGPPRFTYHINLYGGTTFTVVSSNQNINPIHSAKYDMHSSMAWVVEDHDQRHKPRGHNFTSLKLFNGILSIVEVYSKSVGKNL